MDTVMYFDHTKTENYNFGIPDPYPSPLYLFQRLGHMRWGRDKGFVGMGVVYYGRADNNFAEGGIKWLGMVIYVRWGLKVFRWWSPILLVLKVFVLRGWRI